MKDVISAFSLAIGFTVFGICSWQKIDIESSVFRALVCSVACYILGYWGWFVVKIQLRQQTDNQKSTGTRQGHDHGAKMTASA